MGRDHLRGHLQQHALRQGSQLVGVLGGPRRGLQPFPGGPCRCQGGGAAPGCWACWAAWRRWCAPACAWCDARQPTRARGNIAYLL